jgi:hemolysin activation/secretion protein
MEKDRASPLYQTISGILLLLFIAVPQFAFSADIPDTGQPRGLQSPFSGYEITPLPDADEPIFSGFDVPEKRARLPDEKTAKVKQFVVKRLIPKADVDGECVDEFCAVPLEDPALELLLGTLLTQYENQFTIFDLEDVATRVTQFFRQRELILDTAFLPPQTVRDQTVFIHVLQGRLGKITTKGNERYYAYTLLAPFRGMVGRTVRRDEITQALLNVWDYPGLRFAERKAQLTFMPGDQTGLTNLELDVSEEEHPFNVVLSADNSGSDYSGVYRGRVDIDFNDLTDAADQLSVAWMNNYNPENSDFYSISYERPVFSSDLKFGVGHSGNQFVLGQELKELEIDGFSEQSYLSLAWIAKQTFRERLMLGSRLHFKEAVTRQAGDTVAIDQLTVLDVNAGGLFSDEWPLTVGGSSQTLFVATYSHGFGDFIGSMEARDDPDSSRQGDGGEQAGAEFDKLVLELSRRQRFFWDTLLALRLNSQYSDDLLVSLEQMSLGGPDSVRAYPTAEVLRDSGYFVSADWIFKLPFLADEMVPQWLSAGRQASWKQALSFSLFVDHAAGQRNNPLDNEEEFSELSGAGIGLNFETPALMVKMTLAKPLGDVEPSNEEDPQFFMSLQWKLF